MNEKAILFPFIFSREEIYSGIKLRDVSLTIGIANNCFGGRMKQTELLLVSLQIFEPTVKMQMLQAVFKFSANLHWVICVIVRLGNLDI